MTNNNYFKFDGYFVVFFLHWKKFKYRQIIHWHLKDRILETEHNKADVWLNKLWGKLNKDWSNWNETSHIATLICLNENGFLPIAHWFYCCQWTPFWFSMKTDWNVINANFIAITPLQTGLIEDCEVRKKINNSSCSQEFKNFIVVKCTLSHKPLKFVWSLINKTLVLILGFSSQLKWGSLWITLT